MVNEGLLYMQYQLLCVQLLQCECYLFMMTLFVWAIIGMCGYIMIKFPESADIWQNPMTNSIAILGLKE